jgi:spoIIIJ-associated protein
LYIEISTLDSSILIGKHGSTLNAYQNLLNIAVNRKQANTSGNKISIILDTENYRTKRRIALEKMTQRYVSKLNRTKKDVVFPSLNSKERKIIHNYILKNYNIISKSIGDEPNRRIKINFK